MKARGLVRHDLIYGIGHEWKKLVLLIVITVFGCLGLSIQVTQRDLPMLPTFMDEVLYLFGGMAPYIPNSDMPFKIPATWLILHIYLAFFVGSYPVEDLNHYGKNILLRCQKRSSWWMSKYVWCMVSVLVYYAVCYVAIFGFTLFTGIISMSPTYEIQEQANELYLQGIPLGEVAFAAIVLPILTSLALSMIQMVLYLWVSPVLSYVVVVSYLVLSAYFTTPFLIGNYSMIFRNKMLLNAGTSSVVCVIVDSVLIVLAIIVGNQRFKRYDILSK